MALYQGLPFETIDRLIA